MTLLLLGCLLDREGYESARALLVDDDQDGVSEHDGDCDDDNPSRAPNAVEACDGVDNDCDGQVDEDAESAWYPDRDGDGFGVDAEASAACDPGEGWAQLGADCDDTRASVHPDAAETCDGADEDCDGAIDEDAVDAPVWDPDTDADGHTVTTGASVSACTEPEGYSTPSSEEDCDDSDDSVYPGAPAVCGDGVINACGAEGECRNSGPSEVSDVLAENDLGGFLVITEVAEFSGDDEADLIVAHTDVSGLVDEIRVMNGPFAAERAASDANAVWTVGSTEVESFSIGFAGLGGAFPDLVVETQDGDAESLRRMEMGGGVIGDSPVWRTTTAGQSVYSVAFGGRSGYTWVALANGDVNEHRVIKIDNEDADGGLFSDGQDYVSLDSNRDYSAATCDLDGTGRDAVFVTHSSAVIYRFDPDAVVGAVSADEAAGALTLDGWASVQCLPDLGGDGLPDLMIAVPEAQTVYLLDDFPTTGSVESAAHSVLIASGGSTWFGWPGSSGDLDGDGHYDFAGGAVGGDFADFGGGTAGADGGCAVLFYGPFASGTRSAMDPGAAAFCSSHDSSFFGMDVSMSHDLTGDGIDDLVSTAGLETASDGVSQGIVYVIPGLTD